MSPKIMFKFLLIISLASSMCMSSITSMWISLEINMMMFVPLMMSYEETKINNVFMYFLIQSLSSMLFLGMTFTLAYNYSDFLNFLLILSLLFKLGSFPFQGWFMNLMSKISFLTMFFLCTTQKFIPLIILFYTNNPSNLIIISMISNSIFSMIMATKLYYINEMLAISSINNLVWLLYGSMLSPLMVMFYWTFYSLMLFILLTMFTFHNMLNYTSFFNISFFSKLMLLLMLWSISGIPPFSGFFIKLVLLKFLIFSSNFSLAFLLLVSSIFMLVGYMNMFSIIMMSSNSSYMNSSSFYMESLSIIMVIVPMCLGLIIFT